jgi:histidinol-phosphate aminotransferase
MVKDTNIRSLMREHLLGIEAYAGVQPPEVLAERIGVHVDQIIKLDANENPYGPSPKVAGVLAGYNGYPVYPDPQQRRIRQVIAGYVGTTPEHIVAGSGSDELIDLLIRLFIDPGDVLIQCTPTFGMYESFARVCGAELISIPRDGHFDLDIPSICEAANKGSKMIFIPSPNNPTGNLVTEVAVRELLDSGIMVVVDEAYYEFSGSTVALMVDKYPNLIVLRTFSKWAGLASLRIGYGVMHPIVAERLMAIKPPYNITAASELALIASLDDKELLLSRVGKLVQSRENLFKELGDIKGLTPFPSKANFILCHVSNGKGSWLYNELAKRGVFVRYYGKPPIEDYLRISIGLPDQNQALLTILKKTLL